MLTRGKGEKRGGVKSAPSFPLRRVTAAEISTEERKDDYTARGERKEGGKKKKKVHRTDRAQIAATWSG